MFGKSLGDPGQTRSLAVYVALVTAAGAVLLVTLVGSVDWEASQLTRLVLLTLLVTATGTFPLPVAPKVQADVTTAALFAAALLFDAGVAALGSVIGVMAYTVLVRYRGERLRLPWYKYPFNAGQVALLVGLTSALFHALEGGDRLITAAIVPAAASMWAVNASLVTIAASMHTGMSPLRIFWQGTRGNGLAELSLYAFGFLGAVSYQESPWTVVALLIPVGVIYVAFSGLARANTRLEDALTQLESLQGRIVRTSKLASIGTISLDLAHQLKNPLAIMLGRLEGLQPEFSQGSRARRNLDVTLEAGWRMDELIQSFATMGQHRWIDLDIRHTLNEAWGMASLRSRKRIDTRRHYQNGLPSVRGNPVLIREAFFNLFSNAMDAVAEGGTIDVSAIPDNGTVTVRISDNGPGIPAEFKGHLFQPFHSTKPNGLGLGLFASRHILEMHQGTVEIDSPAGHGTSVTVILPVAEELDMGPEEGSGSLLSARSG